MTIDPGGPAERVVDALVDAEPVRAGEVVVIRTTGGGGWGDPLDRPYDDVARDVAWRKVSVGAAATSYGVVIADGQVDEAASDALRERLRRAREDASAQAERPFFDRGPGYARLSGGDPFPAVDLMDSGGDLPGS